jgi:Ca-activated chloride channel family protein
LPATPENVRRAITVIESQRGGGGTELLPALKKALSLPGAEGFSRSVVIATDGYVSVEKEAFDLIRDNLGSANMFTFGIGSSVNRYIIEGMARVGMGEPFVITRPEEAPEKAEKFRKLIQAPVLTNVSVNFGQFHAYDVEPPTIPDVLAERPVIVFGKWRGRPQRSIRIEGVTGNHRFTSNVPVGNIKPLNSNEALRYLWARHRIALLSDYNALSPNHEHVKEITNLGLTYNLLTAYTSFVAIDTQIRLKDGQATTVKQPLPLPQGVSDLAVGGNRFAQKTLSFHAPAARWKGPAVGLKDEALEYKHARADSEAASPESALEKIQVELEKITVTEGLSKKAVQRLLEKHIRSIKLCYKESLKKDPNLKGRIRLKLFIDAAGGVIRVNAVKNELKNKALEQCVIQKMTKLAFPAPAGGKKVTVTVTFNLDYL